MSKTKSIVPSEILDRSKNASSWQQLIAEAKLQVGRLQQSIKYFEDQKKKGVPYPKKERSAVSK